MFRVTKVIMLSLLFSSVAFADDDDYRGHGRREYYPTYYQNAVQYMPAQPRYVAPPQYGAGYPGQMSYGNYGNRNYQQYQPYREHEEYREREYGRGYGHYRRRHHED